MENISMLIAFLGELAALFAIITPLFNSVHKIKNGVKCQLRSEMLRIYYHNHKTETIRQFEYESFIALYEAYKALKGNSFIDKIYSEIQNWQIIS